MPSTTPKPDHIPVITVQPLPDDVKERLRLIAELEAERAKQHGP